MSRIMMTVTLSLLFIFGFTLSIPMAQGMTSQDGKIPNLLGATVKDSQREDLGKIIEILKGPSGRVAFAVISYWVSDDTQKRVAVPLDSLSCEGQNCVLHASRDTLESAPHLISENDLIEPKMAEDVYRYFGAQPYWTDEPTEK